MKVTVTIKEGNTTTSIDLGFDQTVSMVATLTDNEESTSFFAAISKHPASAVREEVAKKDNLDEETVQRLFKDPAKSIMRWLLNSRKAREILTTEQLTQAIAADLEAAEYIAYNLESFESASIDEIASILAKHNDPKIRYALASNYSIPKKTAKSLTKDPDPQVRAAALEKTSRS